MVSSFTTDLLRGYRLQCGIDIWQVLYWGLRDLKRVNLFEVEKPQIRMECAGQMIESEEIANYKQNPNFSEIVKHFDVVSLLKKEIKRKSLLHTTVSQFMLAPSYDSP